MEQENLLKSILDQQPEMICRFLPDTTILFANLAFCYHLHKSREEVLGLKYAQFLNASQQKHLYANIALLQTSKEEISQEKQYRSRQGTLQWQRWVFRPILTREGQLVAIQATGTDISQEKKKKESLMQARQKYEVLFRKLPLPVFLLSLEHRLIDGNQQALAMLKKHWGVMAQEGLDFRQVLQAEDQLAFVRDFERATLGESPYREIEMTLNEEERAWLELGFFPISDDFGNILYIALTISNISFQKHLEKELKQQRWQKQAQVPEVRSWPEILWYKNPQQQLVYFDQQYALQWEIEARDIIGKTEMEALALLSQKKLPEPNSPAEFASLETLHNFFFPEQPMVVLPQKDAQGTLLGWKALLSHKSALSEDWLSPAQKKYLSFANYLPNGLLLIFDQEQKCRFLAGSAAKNLQWSDAQSRGKTAAEIFAEAEPLWVSKHLTETLQGERKMFELVLQGSEYLIQTAPIVSNNKRLDYALFILLDISAFRKTQKALAESEDKFRNYLDQAPEGIWVLDKAGNVQYANQVACLMLGIKQAKDLEGQALVQYLYKGKQRLTWAELTKLAVPNQANTEIFLRKGRQRRLPVWIDLAEVATDQLLCFARDISELHKTEKALREAKHRAEQNAAAQAEFLSSMSHEIRTPMNAVIAMSHLLLQDKPRPEQVKNLNTLKFSAENLLVLVNDILDFNKIKSGKLTFEQIDFDLPELVVAICETLRYKAQNKGIVVQQSLKHETPTVLIGDPVRLAQILTNLVDNAIKFTSEGYVSIEISADRLSQEMYEIFFTIKDTGIGISPERLPYIFDQYTQASIDTTRKFGGTGLGLAITKRLIELQGGHIRVESEPGKGSRFYFSLKMKKGHRRHLPPPEGHSLTLDNETPDLHQARILMVEDNEMNQMVAAQFLQKWNAQIDYAQNGEIALDLLQKNEYDIVLMDLEMPVMNGYQTTEHIRQMKGRFTHLPIIALTASAMAEVKERVLQAGMNDYVTKPFRPQVLYQVIWRNLVRQNTSNMKSASQNQSPGATPAGISLDKILEISGGNQAFIRKYKQLAAKVFENFPDEFAYALLHLDLEKLRQIHHNMRATIGLLGLEELESEIQQGRLLCEMGIEDDEARRQLIHKVKQFCRNYLKYLEVHF
ncbi:MAG: hypothetical protein OHK0053_35750 [Microscillaceae bacterium]